MSRELIVSQPFGELEQEVYQALNMVQSGVGTPEQWLIDALGGGSKSASGAHVNYDSVMGIPAAYRSVNIIAGHIAAMPKEVRRTLPGGGSEVLKQHPAAVVSNMFCNDLQTCFTMWQTMMSHTLLVGNSRAFIERDGNGAPASLTVLMPNASYTVVINGAKWHVTYFTDDQYNDVVSPRLAAALAPFASSANASSGGTGYQYMIPDEEVIHIPGIGYTGMWGYPLTILAKDTFGVDISGLESVSYQFGNGGRPGLLLTAPTGLLRTEKEANEFMKQFRGTHEGAGNTGRTGLLREGMTATTLDAVPADSGLASLRQFSQDDIALLFGTEYLLGKTSAVYKDLPDRFAAYVTNTLNPWMETIEQECDRKLLTTRQVRSGLYFHLDAHVLQRGSPNNLADYTGKLRTQGLISGNEGREIHGFNPVPELADDYLNPNVQSGKNDESAEEPTESEPEQEEEDTSETARLATAIAYNFKSLIEYEQRRIRALSKKDNEPAEFIDAVTRFYDGYQDKLEKTCADLSVSKTYAERHIETSKALIAERLGIIDRSERAEEISGLVAKWTVRSVEFSQ